MKGQCKRFVNLKGESYDTNVKLKRKQDENIGFLSMWRYSTTTERLVTIFGVFLGTLSSFGTIGGIVIYGELTALFVTRHKGVDISGDQYVLRAFGGGERIPPGDSELHMSALVDDSIAFAIASFVIITLHIIIAAVAVTIVGWAAARMVSRLRIRLLRSVISQEIAFFDTNTTMNFASTLTEDMEKFRGGVGEHVVMTANLAGTVLLGAALALTYGWQLTLAGLAVVPISVFIAMLVAKNQTKYSSEEVKAYGAAGRVVEEALSSVQTVRAYGGEDEEVRRYVSALALGGPATRGRGTWAGAGAGLGWFLTYALNSVVLAFGAQLCVRDMDLPPEDQEYHPGIMVTVLFLTSMAAQNIAMCQPHLEVFSAARGAARALFALVERDPAVPARAQGARPPAFRGDLGFDNLYFNYPSRPDVKVLRGLTLHVKAGETVALVGPSGCGKSTLLQLLQRLYEPEAGSIAVDGHKLTELDLHYFRKSIGVVGQEPVLFSGSVRENITLGAEGVAQGDVERAARLANAHPFIVKLKHGYDTLLDAGGAQLSGGQKQRLAIARAVLREPPILLLDEPTSALDPRAERLVQAALDSASKGRTTLVVSHRLATIVNASRIVYIEQGSVLEQGTHAELLEKKGAYWKLVQEDMTQRDLSEQLLAESQEEDEAPLEPEPFVRCLSRASNCVRGSTSSFARGSLRLSPAGRVPVSTDVTDIDTEESEEDEKAPEVSSLALLKLNAKEWPLLMGGALASLVMGTIMPLFALLFSWIYGMFALSDKAEILALARLYAGLFAGIAALCGVFTFLQTWLFNLAGAKLTARLREITFRNYLNQEQGWFDRAQNSVGALCARLGSDAGAVQGATGTRLGTALQGAATMLIGITLAMCFSWKMTLVSLVSVPCVIGGIYLESLVNRRSEVKERKALEHASRIATEAVLNVRTVHSLGVEEWVLSRYCAAVRAARAQAGAARRARGPVYGLCVCAPTVGYAVSLAYGGYLVAREGLPYQYAILVSEALIYGAWMLAAALAFAPSFAAAKRSGARIIAALERTPTVVTETSAEEIQGWSPTGEVQYKGVHFSYPARAGTPVLKGVSLRVPPGATLALVGPSGCGKSTLMQLLLRNYDPNSGSIELDGKNIKRTLTLPQLRHQLGLVPQEPALFTRSIRDNIAYGDHSRLVPMDEIIEAAKQANVHTFVAGLPMGYDTMIGGGKGASLSGGQKQRLGIARALVRKPRLLLLDEPTSALDANSEKVVQAALEAAAKGRTTIIIAHRLATVQHADVICVIDKGVVAETGSHEELLKKQGIYWELWRQQTSQASNTDS